ncbi:competence protein [Leptospira fainei serovar Hurstbridge str. BUT 6]|uniref:Competence protein n=1 Tax=Leptospira fainei serovar Hurstbridge str. BUT 6 TaxID=1193011 RepID=S3V1S5_9LEPT|nr:ComEC/Rec2 family competence protein [Leptospira fainei]EPG74544.1 competence protein [Leptospira fainei serovar Hurstbridge str. BUT 6]
MIRFLEEKYRDWIPSSSFSYLVLGILSSQFCRFLFVDFLLVWTGIGCISIVFVSFLKPIHKKALSFGWGILLFFLLLISGFTKRTAPFLNESKIWKDKSSAFVGKLLESANVEGLEKEISLGLVLGDAKNLNKDFKQDAKDGGILHLFAASGLHLGILLGCVFAVLKHFPVLGYFFPRVIPILLGLLYFSLLGFPVSLARAWVFSSFLLLQTLFFRRTRPSDLLIASTGILYFWDPVRSFGVSFLLSFGAVASILLLKPCLDLCFPQDTEDTGALKKIGFFFRENLTLSFAAGLGTFPTLVACFGTFSFGSLGINLLLVPLCGILLPLLYSALLIEFLSIPYLKDCLWLLVKILINILGKITVFWSENELTFSKIYRGESKQLALVVLVLFIVFLFFIRSLPIREEVKSSLNLSIVPKKSGIIRKIVDPILLMRLSLLIFCIGFYYLLAVSSQYVRLPPIFYGDKFSFVIRNEKELVLGGKCKYSSNLFYKSFGKDAQLFCGENSGQTTIENVYIEDESCMRWILSCFRHRTNARFQYGGKKSLSSRNLTNWQIVPKRNRFSLPTEPGQLIRFEVGKDSVFSLVKFTQQGRGIILLSPRFGKLDNAKEWNKVRKQLGIGSGWEFIGSNELPGIPVF